MGKLTSTQLQFIAANKEAIDKVYNCQIKFCFNNKVNGERAFDMIGEAYKSDIERYHYGTDKRDFRYIFVSKDRRNEVYNEIIEDLTKYHEQNGYDGGSAVYNSVFGDASNSKTGTNSNRTKYIIVAMVALFVIALVLTLKKKKK